MSATVRSRVVPLSSNLIPIVSTPCCVAPLLQLWFSRTLEYVNQISELLFAPFCPGIRIKCGRADVILAIFADIALGGLFAVIDAIIVQPISVGHMRVPIPVTLGDTLLDILVGTIDTS